MPNEDFKRSKIPRNVLIVAFVAFASGLGQDLITPILPGFMVLLGLSRADIGLIDGLLQGVTSLFRFVSGILSDRIHNRKWPVFVGYALSSVSRPLLAFVASFGGIAVLRMLDGIGKGTKDAPRDALVADSASASRTGRAFGFQRLIDTLGSVIGPFTAGALLVILGLSLKSYHTIFAVAAIPGALALGLILFGIREPLSGQRSELFPRGKIPSTFWLFTFATAIAALTKVNDSLVLIRAGDAGIQTEWIPFLFAGFTLVYALCSYPIGIWSDRLGRLPFLATGWFILAIVEFFFSFRPGIVGALLLAVGYGLFYALTEGSGRALIRDLVPIGSRGTAYGIFHTIVGVSFIFGGYGIGTIWDQVSREAAFRVSAAGSLLGCVAFVLLAMHLKKKNRKV